MNDRLMAAGNGLFRLPADEAALRSAADAAGAVWRSIDLRKVRGRRGLFGAFARGCGFPGTFGHNWDALADALQDLSWLDGGLVLVLRGPVAGADAGVLHDILRESAAYWHGRGRVFVACAEDDGLPAWPAR